MTSGKESATPLPVAVEESDDKSDNLSRWLQIMVLFKLICTVSCWVYGEAYGQMPPALLVTLTWPHSRKQTSPTIIFHHSSSTKLMYFLTRKITKLLEYS